MRTAPSFRQERRGVRIRDDPQPGEALPAGPLGGVLEEEATDAPAHEIGIRPHVLGRIVTFMDEVAYAA